MKREIDAEREKEDAWLDDDQVVDLDVKRPPDKIIPVRLSSDQWARLRREATELGVGPSTLIRICILERLRAVAADKKCA